MNGPIVNLLTEKGDGARSTDGKCSLSQSQGLEFESCTNEKREAAVLCIHWWEVNDETSQKMEGISCTTTRALQNASLCLMLKFILISSSCRYGSQKSRSGRAHGRPSLTLGGPALPKTFLGPPDQGKARLGPVPKEKRIIV